MTAPTAREVGRPPRPPAHTLSAPLSTIAMDNEPLTPELMLAFYRRLYPFKSLFNWLNHEHTPTKLFYQREFAFTLQGDVYLRYQSFMNAEELKKQVCALNPTRFEIGPMYSARVSPLYAPHATLADSPRCRSRKTRRPSGRRRSCRCSANSCSIST